MRKISETALQLFEFTLVYPTFQNYFMIAVACEHEPKNAIHFEQRSSSNAFAGALRTCSKFHTVLVEPSAKEGVTFRYTLVPLKPSILLPHFVIDPTLSKHFHSARYKVTPRVCRESKLTNQGTFSVGAAIVRRQS